MGKEGEKDCGWERVEERECREGTEVVETMREGEKERKNEHLIVRKGKKSLISN